MKKVVEKIKEERAERENSLFFVFLSKQDCFSLHEVMCARGAPKMCLDASKNSLNSTQFSLQFSQNSITLCCYFSVKAKSEYAHHQTKSTQKEKEFI